MEWIVQLLQPGNTGLASTILLYSFVIAFGVYLGKMKIGGVSLGVTFVLFVGLLLGHFGYKVNENVLHFIRDFGLILFIFSIGLQVGPGFFSSFKKGGMRLNALAAIIVAINVIIVIMIYYIDGNTSITALVGVMSGAVTNTPGLGAAQQAILQVHPDAYNLSEEMAMGYAAAYPLGVIGIILSMFIIKAVFRIKMEDEIKEIEDDMNDNQLKPHIVSFEVTNPLIAGKNLQQLHEIINCNFVISRVKDQEGNVIIPNSDTTLQLNDKVIIVMSAQDEHKFVAVIGPEIDMDWEATPSPVVSRRILVTNSHYNGVSIGSLRLRAGYNLNATRVNRAGVDLLASPGLRLQVGDRITVVGQEADTRRLGEKLGNSMKRLNEPNMVTLFVGIFLGILVGSIPIAFPGVSVPMKLGLAGGPLVVAILITETRHLHIIFGIIAHERDRYLPVPCIGGHRLRSRIRRHSVQPYRYVVGNMGFHHHGSAPDHRRLHRQRGVEDQHPDHNGSFRRWYDRSPCIGLCQQQHRQRRSGGGILHSLSIDDVLARCRGTDSRAMLRLSLHPL